MPTLPNSFKKNESSLQSLDKAVRLNVPSCTTTFQTVLARADLAYAQSVLLRTHCKGNFGEAYALRAFLRNKFEEGGNWFSLTPRTGRQGFDHLFVRINKNGSYSFMVGESKYGSSQLGLTKGNVRQMSWKWIHARANKLGDAYINVAEQQKVLCKKMPFFNSGLKSYDVVIDGKKVTFWKDKNGNWYFTGKKEQLAVAQKEAAKMGKAMKTAEIRARLFRIKKSGDDIIVTIDKIKSSKNSGEVQIVKGKQPIVIKGILSKRITDEELRRQIAEELHKKFPNMKENEVKELADNLAEKYKNGTLLEQAKSVAKSIALQSLVAAGVAAGMDLIVQLISRKDINWQSVGVAAASAAAGTTSGQIMAIGLMKTKVGTMAVRYIAKGLGLKTYSLLRNSISASVGALVATAVASYGTAIMGYSTWKDANRNFITGSTGVAGGVLATTATTSLVATYGTSSTGTAIAALTGAAQHNAIMKWLGSLVGGGMQAGAFVLGGIYIAATIAASCVVTRIFSMHDENESRCYILLLEEKMKPLWDKIVCNRLALT